MRGSTAIGPAANAAATPAPGDLQLGTFRYLAHQDANWDWKTFNIDTDPALAKKMGGIIDAVDTDMSKFKNRGGKLLLYHGWADPAIQPEHTINYYNSVVKALGGPPQAGPGLLTQMLSVHRSTARPQALPRPEGQLVIRSPAAKGR